MRFLEQTLVNKESHATLILGQSATGKTLVHLFSHFVKIVAKKMGLPLVEVVRTVLKELDSKHTGKFQAICLEGLLHSDEQFALLAISEALGLQDQIKDISRYTHSVSLLLLLFMIYNF